MSEFSRTLQYAKTSLAVGVASVAVGAYQNNNYQDNITACSTELAEAKQIKECTARSESGPDGTLMNLLGAAAIIYGALAGFAATKAPGSLEDYRSRRKIDREDTETSQN